ncbi:MAG: hypothetical protein WC637_12325 [Victivallales bacterium]
MADEKLIEKIMLQVDGLLRGNLSQIIGDLDQLTKENCSGEIPVTVKVSLMKGQFYVFSSSVAWNKAVKHTDEAESETYDPNQPDLFDDSKPATVKDAVMNFKNKMQKMSDRDGTTLTMIVPGHEPVVVSAPKIDAPMAKPRKIKS